MVFPLFSSSFHINSLWQQAKGSPQQNSVQSWSLSLAQLKSHIQIHTAMFSVMFEKRLCSYLAFWASVRHCFLSGKTEFNTQKGKQETLTEGLSCRHRSDNHLYVSLEINFLFNYFWLIGGFSFLFKEDCFYSDRFWWCVLTHTQMLSKQTQILLLLPEFPSCDQTAALELSKSITWPSSQLETYRNFQSTSLKRMHVVQ